MNPVSNVLENPNLCNVLDNIFSHLDPNDIKRCSLVSRVWRDALHSDTSKAWQWARLSVDLSKFPEQEQDLLSSRKLTVLSQMRIRHGTKFLVDSVLRAISEGTTRKLKTLDVSCRLDSIDAILLSRAAVKVEDFTILGGKTSQLHA